MPSWGKIGFSIHELIQQRDKQPHDRVRRGYLVAARQKTGRAVILYATKWTLPDQGTPPQMLSIGSGDLQGFMEVMHGVKEDKLDLILHSPGGGIDAAAAIVDYLRKKFTHIRAIVPSAAMSAAGMIACACDEIVMGKHSFLGPSDPQFNLPTPLGGYRQVAAQSIIEQFERARRECLADQRNLAVWAPILSQYGPDLLVQADRASKLSRELVQQWLSRYMFKGDADADTKAATAATWLSSHENFNSHGRHINRDELRAKGLKIVDLEADEEEQDIFLSVFHATTHTMTDTGAVKIIENHLGRAFINQMQSMLVQAGVPVGVPNQPAPGPGRAPAVPPVFQPGLNRAQRRELKGK
ncbi:ATP-dependent Clp protease proteolytic subunit [Xenophilus sp. Marseille-Q4582]|uniref:SDH family Clp fold serine proteinase n=1 Tax=Xenophilus sp. Marseille-Q4582 TaxID=2866600 RepID=UPI001CE44A0B|nr:ATP-dependent Clp protease proteolytic subunit [Xenophilus sp. Marseille-Q4582]